MVDPPPGSIAKPVGARHACCLRPRVATPGASCERRCRTHLGSPKTRARAEQRGSWTSGAASVADTRSTSDPRAESGRFTRDFPDLRGLGRIDLALERGSRRHYVSKMNSRDLRKSAQGRKAAGPRKHPVVQGSPARRDSVAGRVMIGLDVVGRRDKVWVLGLMAAYAAVLTLLSIVKYRYYLYTDFDLAIFAHAEERLLHGTLDESIGGMSWLGGHVSPVLFLTAPLYAIFRHPVTLLVLQSAALALGAWPVFQLARREVAVGFAPVGLAALYLFYPALGYLNLFEFHPEALATPALLFAFTAMRAGRLERTLAWTALALSAREDVALPVLAMAAHALATRAPRSRRSGAALAGLAVASLLLSFAVVLPHFGSGKTDYRPMYAHWGASASEVFAHLIG